MKARMPRITYTTGGMHIGRSENNPLIQHKKVDFLNH
jgi:hypothetical protein